MPTRAARRAAAWERLSLDELLRSRQARVSLLPVLELFNLLLGCDHCNCFAGIFVRYGIGSGGGNEAKRKYDAHIPEAAAEAGPRSFRERAKNKNKKSFGMPANR